MEVKKPAPRIKPIDRSQSYWRPIVFERLIPADHLARAIWELTGQLDLSRYYEAIRAVAGGPGREHLEPRLMISLWVLGYSCGISSSRELARRCEEQAEFMWLCGGITISYHSRSSFRVAHKEWLEGLFIDHLAALSREGLIDLSEVMHDGTKIRAQASGGSFRREGSLKKHQAEAQQRVEKLTAAEANGSGEESELSARQQAARRRAARERAERLAQAVAELSAVRETKKPAERADARVSETEPEARVMKHADGGFGPSYNLQISTERSGKFIVGAGATQSGGDPTELVPAVERIVANFKPRPEGDAPALVPAGARMATVRFGPRDQLSFPRACSSDDGHGTQHGPSPSSLSL